MTVNPHLTLFKNTACHPIDRLLQQVLQLYYLSNNMSHVGALIVLEQMIFNYLPRFVN